MTRYRWDSPFDWLSDRAKTWDEAKLRHEFEQLAMGHDSDFLQDCYQSEMEEDGYFEPLNESK